MLFSERQENRDRGWNWGRKGKGEAGSLKRFFRVSRRFEILKRAATASGDMALVHTQHVLYAASPALDVEEREREKKGGKRRKERRKEERKEKKKGRREEGLRSPLVSGCWWTFLHFIRCFPPWLRASWILYDRHSPHHRLFCLLLSNNTRSRPTYVKCTVFCATYCLFRSNLYPFFSFSFLFSITSRTFRFCGLILINEGSKLTFGKLLQRLWHEIIEIVVSVTFEEINI